MTRRNFTKAVKVQIIKRATRANVVYCEGKNCGLPCRRFEIHHIKMDALEIDKSRKLTAAGGLLLCEPCHDIETKAQAPILAQARAREASALGVRSRPVIKLKSAPFPKSSRTLARQPKTMATGNAIGRRYRSETK